MPTGSRTRRSATRRRATSPPRPADEGGGYGVAITQYHWNRSFPPLEHVSLEALNGYGKEGPKHEVDVSFDDAVSVVFAIDVDLVGDPAGSALTGQVNLLADTRGGDRLDSLASGRFYGVLAADDRGVFGVAGVGVGVGVGVDDVASRADRSFAVLLGGEPSACGDEDGGYFWPPPLAAVFGNGSGTKNATTTTSTKPELL